MGRFCWKSGDNLLIPFVRTDLPRGRYRGAADQSGAARRTGRPESEMIFHVLTIFPDFFEGPFAHGVVAKAREAGVLEIRVHNLRDWTSDRHKTVDDRPFGGGEGMLLKPEPMFQAVETIYPDRQPEQKVILLSAQGRLFDQSVARQLSREKELLLICGRYEGVDERVATHLADDELSIGNFVLSGGELAAAVVVDTVARLASGSAWKRGFHRLGIV